MQFTSIARQSRPNLQAATFHTGHSHTPLPGLQVALQMVDKRHQASPSVRTQTQDFPSTLDPLSNERRRARTRKLGCRALCMHEINGLVPALGRAVDSIWSRCLPSTGTLRSLGHHRGKVDGQVGQDKIYDCGISSRQEWRLAPWQGFTVTQAMLFPLLSALSHAHSPRPRSIFSSFLARTLL